MPGETSVDWITLIQMTLALGVLSVCCWLIGITITAQRSVRRQHRLKAQNDRERTRLLPQNASGAVLSPDDYGDHQKEGRHAICNRVHTSQPSSDSNRESVA